ncbi:hypothetical protein P7C70_g2677, partial [Phenoliferia sp. Uapishka_3]
MKPFSKPFGQSLTGVPLFFVTILGCAAGFLLFGYDQGIANALTQSPDFQKTFPSMFDNDSLKGAVLAMFTSETELDDAQCYSTEQLELCWARRSKLAAGTSPVRIFLLAAQNEAKFLNLFPSVFIVARLINGYAVGILTSITPVYVAEISKASIRGMMMSLELVFAATGLMTSFWITYAFSGNTSPFGWRFPLGIQVILILITLFSLLFAPESPRWLIEVGRVDEGLNILERFHGQEYADAALLEIKEAISLEHATAVNGYKAAFANNSQAFRYRTGLSIAVNFFQQATGINMATYYAGTIFIVAIKLAPHEASLALGGLGISGLVACAFGCFVLMEKFGRVRTMMLGAFLNCVGMCLLAGGIANIETKKSAAYAAAAGLYLFIMSFSMTWLPCGWIYGAEVSALAVRNQASALGNAVQYLFNFLIVEVTPVGISSIGWKFYIPFAISNAAMIPLLYFFFPEMLVLYFDNIRKSSLTYAFVSAGLSLEGIDSLFANGKVTMRRSPRAPIEHSLAEISHYAEKNEVEKDSYVENASV